MKIFYTYFACVLMGAQATIYVSAATQRLSFIGMGCMDPRQGPVKISLLWIKGLGQNVEKEQSIFPRDTALTALENMSIVLPELANHMLLLPASQQDRLLQQAVKITLQNQN